MINIRDARLWTALLVVGLSLVTISFALPTLRFGLAAQLSNPQMAKARLDLLTQDWPVGAQAQRLSLFLAPPRAADARVDALQSLLAETPMSSGGWLDLAIARREAGQPMAKVASALVLSSLTGPNEALFMGGRAAFALPIWDRLPPELRRSLIGDLVVGWGAIDDARRRELEAILTVASDPARAQILAALLLYGKQGAPIIAALDLAPRQDLAPGGEGGPDKALTAPEAGGGVDRP
jgi:hypothetical protein